MLQRRIMGRIALILSVLLVIIVVAVVAVIQWQEQTGQQRQREADITRITAEIESALVQSADELTTMADTATIRTYALQASLSSPGTLDAVSDNIQTDLLRMFDALITNQDERYLAVRYLNRANQVYGEALNLGNGVTRINPEPELNGTIDEQAIAAAQTVFVTGGAYIGAIGESLDGVPIISFYAPVIAPGSSAEFLGMVQLEVAQAYYQTILDRILASPAVQQDGRRLVLANNNDVVIAASGGQMTTDEITRYLAALDGTTLGTLSLDSGPVIGVGQIERFDGQGKPWHILLVDDLAAFGTPIGSIVLIAAGLALVTGFAILLVLEFALRPLTRPLHDLGERASSLTTNLPQTQDEIRRAATALDALTGRIAGLEAQANREEQRYARDLEVAARIGREVATLDDLDTLLKRAINRISEAFGYYHTQVFLTDDVGENAVLIHSRGRAGERLLEKGFKLAIGSHSVIGQVTQTGQPVLVKDTKAPDGPPHRPNPELPLTRSELGVPLVVGGQVIGALDIQSQTPNAFSQRELATFKLLADQLAVAIYNARLAQQNRYNLEELESLNRRLTRFSWQEGDQRLNLDRAFAYDLLDVKTGDDAPEISHSVPIELRREIIGALQVQAPEQGTLSEAEQTIMRSVADRVSMAIENARLFEETQTRLEETDILYQLSRSLNQVNEMGDIVQCVIYTVLPQAVGGQVWVFDEYHTGTSPEFAEVLADFVNDNQIEMESLVGQRLAVDEHPFIGDLRRDRITWVDSVYHDRRLDPDLRQLFTGMETLVFIPLSVRGHWRGFISINFLEPYHYSRLDEGITSALVDQVGVVIENRLLLRQSEEEAFRNERLYSASRQVNAALNMKDLVNAAVVTRDAPWLDFSLSLVESELDSTGWPIQAHLVAESRGGEVFDADEVFALDIPKDSPLRNRQAEIVVDHDPDNPKVSNTIKTLRERGWRFMATFPLFSSEQLIALFRVMSPEIQELDTSDYDFYRALTGQMSSQIRIRTLLDSTEAAVDENRRLYYASSGIAEADSEDSVYQITTEHLAGLITRQEADIEVTILRAYPLPSLTTPYLEYAYSWNPHVGTKLDYKGDLITTEHYPYPVLADEYGELSFAQLSEGATLHPALTRYPALRERLLDDGIESLYLTPISSQDYWFGVILCTSRQPRAFDEQFRRFVPALADQVAIALNSLRLYDDSQREAERAQAEAQRSRALADAAQIAMQIRIGEEGIERGLSAAMRRVAENANLDRWMLLLVEGDTLRRIADDQLPPSDLVDLPMQFPIGEDSPYHGLSFVNILDADKPQTINDPLRYIEVMGYEATDPRATAVLLGKHIVMAIRRGGLPIGVLYIGRDADTADFGPSDESLISTLAAQITITLENRQLFDTIQREQRVLSSILQNLPVGVLVLDATTLQPREFNEQAQHYLGREIDPTRPFSIEEYNLRRTGTQLPYPLNEIPILTALRDGQHKMASDVAVIYDDQNSLDVKIEAAPILDSTGQIQSIVVAIQDISDLRMLENDLQENLQNKVGLTEAQSQLANSRDVDELLDVLLEQVYAAWATAGYILMMGDDGQVFPARRTNDLPLEMALLNEVLDRHEVVRRLNIENSNLSEPCKAMFREAGLQAVMSIPMWGAIRNEIIGWIMLANDSPGHFDAGKEANLVQLKDMAATALENRDLLEQQRLNLSNIQSLYDVSTRISRVSNNNREELDATLWESLTMLQPDYSAAYVMTETDFQEEATLLFEHGEMSLDMTRLAAYDLPEGGFYIDDVTTLKRPTDLTHYMAQSGIRSFAMIGLRDQGFLLLGYQQPHTFGESEVRYLNVLADSSAVVLDNILLFDQANNQLEETVTNYQASKALSEATDLQDILEAVKEYLVRDPHINQIFIAMLNTRSWDDPTAAITIGATWTQGDVIDLYGVTLAQDQFPAWELMANAREVITIENVSADESLNDLERMGITSLEAHSLILIPLRVPNRPIGAIWMSSPQPQRISESDRRIYQNFGEQASLSLEAAYLLQQTEHRARQLETSSRVSQSASRILDLNELLPEIVELIKSSFDYDHVQVFLMDEADEYAELRASTGDPGEKLLAIHHKLRKNSSSVIGQVTAKGTPQVALDTADANVVHKPNSYLPLTRSELALPLIVQNRVVGALDVQSNKPNAFDDEDTRVLETLAAQISVAIDNANLYNTAQQQADDIRFLFDLTTQAAANELESALEIIVERLHDEMEALTAVVYLRQNYIDQQDGSTMRTLKPMALAGSNQPLDGLEEVALDRRDHLIAAVGNRGEPYVIQNITAERRYLPVSPSASSALLLPMATPTDLIGLVVVEHALPDAFDERRYQLLTYLVRSLTAVVQSLLLLEELTTKNKQLQELDRLKSDFLANMSHELRTPLNSIIGFSRVMLKGFSDPLTKTQEQDLTTIHESGKHLLDLINSILDQAKIAAGKMEMSPKYLDVKPMVESIRSIGIGLVKEKPIEMQAEVEPGLPQIYADEQRIRQVLMNIVSNAVKFTKSGYVRVSAYLTEEANTGQEMVRFDVEDSGIGIAKEHIPLLFEPFRQVDSSLTRTQDGTGLGLPLAKSMVELQGGAMFVESEPNVGSLFSFTMPTSPPPETRTGEHVAVSEEMPEDLLDDEDDDNGLEVVTDPIGKPPTPVRKYRSSGPSKPYLKREILLIEDNRDMVNQFQRILQHEGYQITAAEHPSYAEAMASQLRPTLIVLDVNFGEGEGWNTLERLKQRDDTVDLPVVVVTLSGEAQRAYDLGANEFIQRPFVPEDLMQAVRRAEAESRRKRILVIDDDPESIRWLKTSLEEDNHRVFTASTGPEGLGLAVRRRPDLILLDLKMPQMDGFDVLQELRANQETANISVMIVTAEPELAVTAQDQLADVRVFNKLDDQFIADVRNELHRKS